jgi:hypothetical protein
LAAQSWGRETYVTNSACKRILAAGLAAGVLAGSAFAAERTGINTGTTSFFDGFGGDQPGCTYIQYLGYDKFKTVNDASGSKLADFDLGVTYGVPQLACSSSYKLFGGALGWNTIVPVSGLNSSTAATHGAGLGDIVAGPTLVWTPIIQEGRPVFAHGVELDIFVPTGKYSSGSAINPGNDYWSLSPFWRATYLPAPGWEFSWRVSYIYNFDHRSAVNVAGPGGTTVTQNGDGLWLNFTASKEIFKNFYFGANGYWLKQLHADKGTVGGQQQESFYFGPGFHYTIDPKNMINFNVYLPVYDANSLSGGYQVNLQYIHPLN